MNKEKLARIQGILNEMVETSYVAGINCLILENGKEQGYYEAGYIDISEKRILTRDSIFLLYSMTKPVTAAAIMMLMEDGVIDLLDPVEKYLSGFKAQKVAVQDELIAAKRQVTIKNLLSMTSGLVYGGQQTRAEQEMDKLFADINEKLFTDHAYSTIEVANKIGQCPLQFEPGEHWQYGTSADVLGAIVEVASGMHFGDFLEERLFRPLGMKDTAFCVPEEKKSRFSKVYLEEGNALREYHGNHLGIMTDMPSKPAFESGGAGLVSTIDDYAKFATMLLNKGTYEDKHILSPRTVEFMTSSHLEAIPQKDLIWENLPGYTYGNLMRIMVDSSLAVINGSNGEYGWDGWLGPYFMNDPVHGITVLMMQQRTDSGTTTYTRRLRNMIAAAIE